MSFAELSDITPHPRPLSPWERGDIHSSSLPSPQGRREAFSQCFALALGERVVPLGGTG